MYFRLLGNLIASCSSDLSLIVQASPSSSIHFIVYFPSVIARGEVSYKLNTKIIRTKLKKSDWKVKIR